MITDQYSDLRDFPLRRRSNVYSRILHREGGHLSFNTLPDFAFQKRTHFKSFRSVTFLCLIRLSPFPDSHPFFLTSLRLVLLGWGKLLVLQVPGDQRSRVSATWLAPGKEELVSKLPNRWLWLQIVLQVPGDQRSRVSATWLAPGKEGCSLKIAQQMAVTAESSRYQEIRGAWFPPRDSHLEKKSVVDKLLNRWLWLQIVLQVPGDQRSRVSATWLAPGKEECSSKIAQQMALTADSHPGTRRLEEQGFRHVTRTWQISV